MSDLIILKLGGSSITKKSENKFEINYELLERIAREIKNAKDNLKFNLIIVCGVGPFGHTNVKQFNINDGIQTEEQLAGVKKTNLDCNFVGNEVINILKRIGLKAKIVSGEKIILQENKKVYSFLTKKYVELIENDIIPVSTGIMVPDTKLVWSVISGDQIIAQLSNLSPKKILLGTDVDGIFDEDPKINEKAELIELITKENFEEVLKKCGDSKAIDVTGGMKGKLEKISKTINNTPTIIFNLFVEKNLENALIGKEIKSTKIEL